MATIHIIPGRHGVIHITDRHGALYYGGGYGYPTQVIVVESGYRGPVYGKRASRSTQLSGVNDRAARSYNRQVVETNTNQRPAIGGRTSSSVNSQSDYYNRGWRNQTQQNSSSYTLLRTVIPIHQEPATIDLPGKATPEVRGATQILVTLREVMIQDEAAAEVLILAGIVAARAPDHPVPVQDHQAAAIN